MDSVYNKSSIYLKGSYQNNNLLIEGFTDQNCCRMKLILRESKTTSLINMMKKEKLKVAQVDQRIRVLMQARDQVFQEDQKGLKRVVYKKIDNFLIKY